MADEYELNIAEAFGATETRTQRLAIYIPNKTKDGVVVQDQEYWIKETVNLLANIFGGATAMPPLRGAWLNKQTGQLVEEEPVLVYSFIEPDAFVSRHAEIRELIHRIGRETKQGQMAFEFDSALHLIDIEVKETT